MKYFIPILFLLASCSKTNTAPVVAPVAATTTTGSRVILTDAPASFDSAYISQDSLYMGTDSAFYIEYATLDSIMPSPGASDGYYKLSANFQGGEGLWQWQVSVNGGAWTNIGNDGLMKSSYQYLPGLSFRFVATRYADSGKQCIWKIATP